MTFRKRSCTRCKAHTGCDVDFDNRYALLETTLLDEAQDIRLRMSVTFVRLFVLTALGFYKV